MYIVKHNNIGSYILKTYYVGKHNNIEPYFIKILCMYAYCITILSCILKSPLELFFFFKYSIFVNWYMFQFIPLLKAILSTFVLYRDNFLLKYQNMFTMHTSLNGFIWYHHLRKGKFVVIFFLQIIIMVNFLNIYILMSCSLQ